MKHTKHKDTPFLLSLQEDEDRMPLAMTAQTNSLKSIAMQFKRTVTLTVSAKGIFTIKIGKIRGVGKTFNMAFKDLGKNARKGAEV